MRKIINHADNVVREMLEGYVGAYNRYYRKHPDVNGVILKQRRKGKVALVIGGGSGHEPMFSGFVGKGLADAAACGNIFASPDPNTVYETAKAVEEGQGVLFVYGCYAGDNLNFDMGEEMLQEEGIQTTHVRVWDDVASAPRDRIEDRRGIAGDVFVVKIAGAACDAGLNLAEVTKLTEKARDNTKTIGVATASAQLPGVEKPIFELGENEIEYGMGLHGERGVLRTHWQSADVLAEKMYGEIKKDTDLKAGDEVCVLINGLGSTTITELAIVYRKVGELLERDGIKVYDADLNNYCTSQEMGGFSITLFQLDEELKQYYDMPCFSPYYAKGELMESSREELECCEKELVSAGTQAEGREEETVGEPQVSRKAGGALTELSAEDVKGMLLYIADKIRAKKPYLTEIDSAIGDGDHGIGMAGGMKKIKEKLWQMEGEQNAYAVFEAAGKAMLMSMGGASGVIFGSLYLAGAKEMDAKAFLTAEDLAKMERKSLSAIKERGKAEVGDKTMVDALEPAVVAMEKNYEKGLLEMLKAAEEAARQGVEETKKYTAKFGRAKSLMERAVGYQDAGATSVWLIFQGMREYIEG
ncbi:dihydroxyacetone kinase subunit DhaL [Faecalicatena contorta]|uniref:phosphoenolpyruvate--glycerone phosphotransferase n=1 Tax=Faecalicatena contorta TaxID=39482 RepID=A0A315ZUZ5_9FIRM|nr:dihydroxyacetone kinase subunit DhaL [Faecalicatena contorta]PWJ48678.1 homodimeric dihydroxyacetone kinase [Faecalicatena contorta]SUQ15101.1 homodimeric dihydroxyacetone kinase [Faecalicatena contorta]